MSENRLGKETSPYLLQHGTTPSTGGRGDRRRSPKQAPGQADPAVGRLRGLPLVPCHGARELRGPGHRRRHERAVRQHQGRPRGAARHRRDLHGRAARARRAGRLAADHVPRQRRRAVLGRHLLSQGRARYGRPAFTDVLRARLDASSATSRDDVAHNAEHSIDALRTRIRHDGARSSIDDALLQDLTARMVRAVDPVHGGLQRRAEVSAVELLLAAVARRHPLRQRRGARTPSSTRCDNICQGGIYDHLGGGFARYSVDERWLVPHFEKMLYDNALLIDLMTEVWRETQAPLFTPRIAETVAWLEREMIAEGGGFAASLDADLRRRGRQVLRLVARRDRGRARARRTRALFRRGLRRHRGRQLRRPQHPQPAATGWRCADRGGAAARRPARQAAGRARQAHRPGWDDKVLADWNGLMIAALARAVGRVRAAGVAASSPRRAFDFVATRMSDGRPPAACLSRRPGEGAGDGERLRQHDLGRAAPARGDQRTALFRAGRAPGSTCSTSTIGSRAAADMQRPPTIRATSSSRLRPGTDDATPNANAIMLANLVALATLTADTRYTERASAVLAAFAGDLGRNIVAYTGLLASTFDLLAPQQVVVAGQHLDGGQRLIKVIRSISLPGALQYALDDTSDGAALPGLRNKNAVNRHATAYVCLGPQCSSPLTEPSELANTLKAATKSVTAFTDALGAAGERVFTLAR